MKYNNPRSPHHFPICTTQFIEKFRPTNSLTSYANYIPNPFFSTMRIPASIHFALAVQVLSVFVTAIPLLDLHPDPSPSASSCYSAILTKTHNHEKIEPASLQACYAAGASRRKANRREEMKLDTKEKALLHDPASDDQEIIAVHNREMDLMEENERLNMELGTMASMALAEHIRLTG